jgi:hypothetical protein
MINLTNTKFGTRRRVIIGGITNFDVFAKMFNVLFYVQLIDANGNLLQDKSLNQNRKVMYSVNDETWVNDKFDLVAKETAGSRNEYDYFYELLQKTPLPDLVYQMTAKLVQRGIFD